LDLAEFVDHLESDGELIFPSPEPPKESGAILASATLAIERLDARRRLEMAHEPPALNREQALWALRIMYRAAQFLVFRSVNADVVIKDPGVPCPDGEVNSRTYSVDLFFAWLPEFHRRAARISKEDPLTKSMERMGCAWPLSGVGMAIEADHRSRTQMEWMENPSLRQSLIDRVIATRDDAWLANDRVRNIVRDAVNPFPELVEWVETSASPAG
tara:strand:+ start:5390 stop:6034 length:645 start_codon:yes stop_codon:yes gene_type:complete